MLKPTGTYQTTIVYTAVGIQPQSVPPTDYQTKTTAIVPNFASTQAPTGNGTGTNGPQFSIAGSGFGSTPTVTIGGQPCTNVTVNTAGTAITCTGPVSGITTDGEKRTVINGTDAGDNYTVWYSTYNFPTLQSLTTATCDATPEVYRDTRDSQLYYIAKLADNKCWMMDNLRYKPNGDTSGTVTSGFTATQINSSVTSNNYLTQDGTSSTTAPNLEAAKYVDPIQQAYCNNATNKSTENITKCGLLYNWYTATAGTGLQSITTNGTQVSGSICPAGWRLPSATSTTTGQGNGTSYNYADIAVLNASMKAGSLPTPGTTTRDATTYPNWQPSAAFRGVFSGYWNSGFGNQGSYGRFWSSSVYDAAFARYLVFNSSGVSPGSNDDLRYYGFGVRCVVGM
jgi:uncharacterized protein (TIGR02145 family)